MHEGLLYVPRGYRSAQHAEFWLHAAPDEDPHYLAFLAQTVAVALCRVCAALSWAPGRCLHVCCYASSVEAQQALNRRIPPTMAMAPFCDEDQALVVLHSVRCDVKNADPQRMLRLLAHEITHQFIAERTGSIKRLGDGQAGMHVSSWLNEGLAEATALVIAEQTDRVGSECRAFRRRSEYPLYGTVSEWLDNLEAGQRRLAFSHAVGAVGVLYAEHPLSLLFERLPEIERACPPESRCDPSTVLAALPPSTLRRGGSVAWER
jgi:hypothetical protein